MTSRTEHCNKRRLRTSPMYIAWPGCTPHHWHLALEAACNHSRHCMHQDCIRCPDRNSPEFDHIRRQLQRRLFSTPSTLGKAPSKRCHSRNHRRNSSKNTGSQTNTPRHCNNDKRRFHRTFRRYTRRPDRVRSRSRRMFRPLLGPFWPRYRQNRCLYMRSRSRLHRRNYPICIARPQYKPSR
jgi:hypothetical protein